MNSCPSRCPHKIPFPDDFVQAVLGHLVRYRLSVFPALEQLPALGVRPTADQGSVAGVSTAVADRLRTAPSRCPLLVPGLARCPGLPSGRRTHRPPVRTPNPPRSEPSRCCDSVVCLTDRVIGSRRKNSPEGFRFSRDRGYPAVTTSTPPDRDDSAWPALTPVSAAAGTALSNRSAKTSTTTCAGLVQPVHPGRPVRDNGFDGLSPKGPTHLRVLVPHSHGVPVQVVALPELLPLIASCR